VTLRIARLESPERPEGHYDAEGLISGDMDIGLESPERPEGHYDVTFLKASLMPFCLNPPNARKGITTKYVLELLR
jgi:hypothetical protein